MNTLVIQTAYLGDVVLTVPLLCGIRRADPEGRITLLTTPDGAVLLARAAVLVNVAGTSVVGWILSGSSLVVIAAWWLRTARRRSRSKR